MKISANPKFTTMVTGHGNIKAYLYRFKIAATPTCPCGKKDQTTDHLLYKCEILKSQRDILRLSVTKTEGWPTSRYTLISKHYNAITRFINQIPFDNLH